MFMRFRGGRVGHKATWDWDLFLQRDGHPNLDSSDSDHSDDLEMELDDNGKMDGDAKKDDEMDEDNFAIFGQVNFSDDEMEDDEDDEMPVQPSGEFTVKGTGELSNSEQSDGGDTDICDKVIAHGAEELDDDILAESGYGTL